MLSLRIALRYLASKKSHGAVNVISAISVAGVAVATAAIVVVLSVFNGFTDIARNQFSVIDPDIMVTAATGRAIADADSLAEALETLPGVEAAAPTLTERGLLVAREGQAAVVFKGVPDDYSRVVDATNAVQAVIATHDGDTIHRPAQVAVGVAMHLALRPATPFAELYVPRRIGRINPANPAGAFFSQPLVAESVLAVNQTDFDADHIYIPLDAARTLLQYDREATAVELRAAAGTSPETLAGNLRDALGPEYTVATQAQQHAEAFRMISVEKWVTFAMLIFILVIAAFNIISTLSLLVIEKRDNMATLRFLGASRRRARAIFMWMGAAITIAGGVAGCLLGVALSLAQQYGHFIRLNGDPSKLAVTSYPVRVEAGDLLAVAAIVVAMALITSLITRIFTRKI
ncbi:MAG: FtsX-like permease family protein [Muribaculaceae bacterium]|nr:FtsX-like permease family protein [Muribaculaceae bacterium]